MKGKIGAILRSYGLLLAMAALALVVAVIQPRFLSGDNILNIMRQLSVLGIVSLGMTIIIIGGYMDLSISGTISLVAVVVISMQQYTSAALSVVTGLVIGVVVGIVNAAVVLLVKAGNGESLILTFGMQTVLQATALLYAKGYSIKAPEGSSFRLIGQGTVGFLASPVLIFLALALILQLMMSKTRSGRSIYLTGGNKEAARLCGIPVSWYIGGMYVITGLMAAAGAIVLSSRTMSATPTMGTGYEMDAIMAVVIGGTSLKGGQGSVTKTILGVVLVGVMSNALNIIGVTPYMQSIVKGMIMIAAVWLDSKKTGGGAAFAKQSV